MFTHKIPSCGSLPQQQIGCDTLEPAQADNSTMRITYHLLALNAMSALQQSHKDRIWIAVCGGPGAGKTTLAVAVANQINQLSHNATKAVSISMDGYHYTRAQMRALGYDMKRRGAPWTFDAERLAKDLALARDNRHLCLSLPGYSREVSDPVERMVQLQESHQIVLVEGNYVLLGKLWEECHGMNGVVDDCLLKMPYEYDGPRFIQQEVTRWKPVTDGFDYSWFVHPCDGYNEQRRRLIQRALRTWNDEKTAYWGGETSLEAATTRVDYNDYKNAALVDCCRKHADIVIPSV
ncbi:hypothetical protein MPSEU_000764400 [Mayamaea pseudoterrestris]|nr:hypothetical protein MPSEU_000764400 [Mayamaea pseudoterrestris]